MTEHKVGRKTIFGVHHPKKRTVVRLFIIEDREIIDITQYVAAALKLPLIHQRKWVEIPKGGSNPVKAIVEQFAQFTKRDQKWRDLY